MFRLFVIVAYCCLILTDAADYEFSTSSCVEEGQMIERGDTCEYSCKVTGLQARDYISVTKPQGQHYQLSGVIFRWIGLSILYSSTTGVNPGLIKYGRYSGENHESGDAVTLKISDILPEDTGFLACSIYVNNEHKYITSSYSEVPVAGQDVVPFFAKQNSAGHVVEIYKDGSELSLELEELSDFAFMVNVTGAMPVQPSANIMVKYEDSNFEDITEKFEKISRDASSSSDGNTGIIHAYVRENFEKPSSTFIDVKQGRANLTGTYRYASYEHTASVTLSLLFAPSQFICNEILPVLEGEEANVTCEFASNPQVTFIALTLPTGEIVNNTDSDDRFLLDVSHKSGWMYSLILTYRKISAADFDKHVLHIKNEYGQNSFDYVINDASVQEVFTSSCADNGETVQRGDTCVYSCVASGLLSTQSFLISKEYFAHYELSSKEEVNRTYVTYDSDAGLTPELNETGRYEAELEKFSGDVVQRATVTISDIIPGDSGGYECHIFDGTQIVIKSDRKYIPVLGADVQPSFTINEDFFENGQQINVTLEEMQNLVFMVKVTDAMPVPPIANITAFYPNVDVTEEIISLFIYEAKDSNFHMDPSGIAKDAYVQETFAHPSSSILSHRQGKIVLTGQYEYSHKMHSANLNVNLLFEPESWECKDPLPVMTDSGVEVRCTFLANPAIDSLSLKLPNGKIVESANPEHGVTFEVTQEKIDWHYSVVISYQKISSDFFGTHNLTISNYYGSKSNVFNIRDLALFEVHTTSCLDGGEILERGGYCEYSCQVKGLDPEDSFRIDKVSVRYFDLRITWSNTEPYRHFDSKTGLNEDLPSDRYKAIMEDNYDVTIHITDMYPGDSAGFVCLIKNKYGEDIKRSHETYIPVFGTNITTSMLDGEQELNLTRAELVTLDFTIQINEAMPIKPSASLVAHYPSGLEDDVRWYFQLIFGGFEFNADPSTGIFNPRSRNIYYQPLQFQNVIKSNHGKPVLIGTFSYAHYRFTSNVTINLLFAPEFFCDESYPAKIGDPLNVTCDFSTNPSADSVALQLPNGQVIDTSMSSEEISLSLVPIEVEWLYSLVISYRNITEDNLGQYSLNVTNVYGESSSLFQITKYQEPTTSSPPSEITTPDNDANTIGFQSSTISFCFLLMLILMI